MARCSALIDRMSCSSEWVPGSTRNSKVSQDRRSPTGAKVLVPSALTFTRQVRLPSPISHVRFARGESISSETYARCISHVPSSFVFTNETAWPDLRRRAIFFKKFMCRLNSFGSRHFRILHAERIRNID